MLIPWNRWQAYCRESRFVVYRIVVEKGFSRRTLLSAISEQETVLLPWRCLGEKERGEYIFLGLENRARLREAGKWKRKIWYTSNSTSITYAFKSPSSFDERFFLIGQKKKKKTNSWTSLYETNFNISFVQFNSISSNFKISSKTSKYILILSKTFSNQNRIILMSALVSKLAPPSNF